MVVEPPGVIEASGAVTSTPITVLAEAEHVFTSVTVTV
jgi:hypothetical protein